MTIRSFLISLSLVPFFLAAQVNQTFPYMEGESLTHSIVNLPKDLAGKYSVLGLAFSKKSEDYLKSWFQPAYSQFIYKPETPSLFSGNYDVNVYFVPMFTGAKRPAYEKVMENVSKTIDERLLPYVLFYQGSMKEYRDALGFDGKEIPYFYVLDPAGKIIYTTSGMYTDEKMQEILDVLEPAWGN
ncbi:MAG: mitochondrial ATPase complex subunit ATP10 [Cyclobacteriaceae bacterium]|nr:mitochondrial ATPase complex subunit ATP10 [Cyclobacteriaceae bacterium]